MRWRDGIEAAAEAISNMLSSRFARKPFARRFARSLLAAPRSSNLGMIAAAKCPPYNHGSDVRAWDRIFRVLTMPSSELTYRERGGWEDDVDGGGFTVWHHLACKGREDTMTELWNRGRKERARDGFGSRGVIDVKRGRGGGVVRYRKILEGGGTVGDWAKHYMRMGEFEGEAERKEAGEGKKGKFIQWCTVMNGKFELVVALSEKVEKWGKGEREGAR